MKFSRLVAGAACWMHGVASEIPTADVSKVNWDAVRADIRATINQPDWDDGSYGPIFIRLGWHSSGTYSKHDGTGGSNGATMRHEPETSDPENGGLQGARDRLEPIYEKHKDSGLTHADLWILAAYVGLEMTAGPQIEFVGGRVDKGEGIENGRLPDPEFGLEPGLNVDDQNRLAGWEKVAANVRKVFSRLGFNDAETVALIAGGHSFGRCHRESTGYEGSWQNNGIYFANEFVTDMLGDDWRAVTDQTAVPEGFPKNGGFAPDDVRPKAGVRQYVDITTIDPNIPGFMLGGVRSDDAGADAEVTLGEYTVDTTWMNVRQTVDPMSDLVARVPTGTKFTVVELQNASSPIEPDSSVRGLTLEGGWITLNKGDPPYFKRTGDLDSKALGGKYRKADGSEVDCRRVYRKDSGKLVCHTRNAQWVDVYTPEDGVLANRIEAEYNDLGPRVPLKDKYGHQMMLVSDMVLKWDPGFRKYMDIYNDDEDLLKADFGKQYKRLTELGCPWSTDRPENIAVV